MYIRGKYLDNKHGFGGDLHVVAKLEISQETNSLHHAGISISLESHICNWLARVHVTYDQFSKHIQSRLLHTCTQKPNQLVITSQFIHSNTNHDHLLAYIKLHLVCGSSDDPDGESEGTGQSTGQQDAPVRKLELLSKPFTGKHGKCPNHNEYYVEPPLGHNWVVLHQSGVHIPKSISQCCLHLVPNRPSSSETSNFISSYSNHQKKKCYTTSQKLLTHMMAT